VKKKFAGSFIVHQIVGTGEDAVRYGSERWSHIVHWLRRGRGAPVPAGPGVSRNERERQQPAVNNRLARSSGWGRGGTIAASSSVPSFRDVT
jgi:hypothetical protein